MRRGFWITVGAGAVGGVASGLAREARTLEPETAEVLLVAMGLFLLLEWAAHLVGSRLWRTHYPQADRAAFAALSCAGIWVVLLSTFPMVLQRIGVAPLGFVGIATMTLAAAAALSVRLWFLREIYQTSFERAAALWAVTRGAAAVLAGIALAAWTLSGALGGADLPVLRIGL